jgi:glycosyltransferase involved in cell wall biosynthesis
MSKPSVLFFTQNKWAFGQIHHSLIKRLWEKGIYANLIDCEQSYSHAEMSLLFSKYDTVVTTANSGSLVACGLPPERLVYMAHAEEDISRAIAAHGVGLFSRLKGFGAVNPSIIRVAEDLNVGRVPTIVRNGIDFDHYYAPISTSLGSVGYGSADVHIVADNTDCKRTYLLSKVMQGTGLNFRTHGYFNYLCMPGYYKTIDALLVTSSYESCALPSLEAAAAGRLVISANVGYFDGSHGALCRLPDDEFVEDAKEALNKYKDPALYREVCEKAQQYAREHYDWEHVVDDWIKLFLG